QLRERGRRALPPGTARSVGPASRSAAEVDAVRLGFVERQHHARPGEAGSVAGQVGPAVTMLLHGLPQVFAREGNPAAAPAARDAVRDVAPKPELGPATNAGA